MPDLLASEESSKEDSDGKPVLTARANFQMSLGLGSAADALSGNGKTSLIIDLINSQNYKLEEGSLTEEGAASALVKSQLFSQFNDSKKEDDFKVGVIRDQAKETSLLKLQEEIATQETAESEKAASDLIADLESKGLFLSSEGKDLIESTAFAGTEWKQALANNLKGLPESLEQKTQKPSCRPFGVRSRFC